MAEEKKPEEKEASTGQGGLIMYSPANEDQETETAAIEEVEETEIVVGTLTIRYVNDTPEITLNSGTAIPGEIVVVDAQGNPVAVYHGSALPAGATTRGENHAHGQFLPAGRSAVVPAVVPAHVGLLSDRALKRDVVGVVWS